MTRVTAVRDDASRYGLRAGSDPVERSAGLGLTANIRFHDRLLVDMVRLCSALRAKVPACTSGVCVLIPETMIPRAATGERDDPNSAAWTVAESLGLRRVILYSCVAAFVPSRLWRVEGTASLRLQIVYSGPDELFDSITGDCPNPVLSPHVPEDLGPAIEVQQPDDSDKASNSQWTVMVQRPNPPPTPAGDGCGRRFLMRSRLA